MRASLSFVSLFLVTVFSGALIASSPKEKSFRTQQDFETGELQGVSIDHNGRVLLAPQLDTVYESELPFLWACTVDGKGNVFVAGGNLGQVIKINPKGASEVVFEAPEIQIYSLAVDGPGTLYIASSPNGAVYKLPAGQRLSPEQALFFDPDEFYIWSLAIDRKKNLYVATGDSGNIYKVNPQGQGTIFYESSDTHVRKIIFGQDGNLIAGTANKGLVLRISPAGKAFVMYDSPLVEITDLLQDSRGNIFAAATGDAPLSRNVQPRPAKKDEKGDGPKGLEDLEVVAQAAAPTGVRGQTGELYRIDKEGYVQTYQMLKSERIYSLVEAGPGKILAGAGEKGRLYAITAAGEIGLLATVDAAQITALTKSRNDVYLATSNSGRVYRVRNDLNSEGHFTTKVIDAGTSSQWGSVTWEAQLNGGNIKVRTRSGNTQEPDKTWSEWSTASGNSLGEEIKSPPARFIQLRAILSSATGGVSPALHEISFSYLQKNIAPVVRQVRIHPPSEYYPEAMKNSQSNGQLGNGVADNDFQVSGPGRKANRKGFRSVSWVARDDNDDRMSFNLEYAREGSKQWRRMAEDFTGSAFSWDSELMPDGRYLIKIETADDLSNPPALVLRSEKISQPFTIDNTGPAVSDILVKRRGQKTLITFSISDQYSKIKSVQYGINGQEWLLVYPEDGICDSKMERFSVEIATALDSGSSVVVKAKDSTENIGFGQTVVQ